MTTTKKQGKGKGKVKGKGKGKAAVAKGFLNKPSTKKAIAKQPMYPDGSNEGMKQHPWNSIMHKSKVIDLNECTPEQQAKYNAGSRDPKDFEPQKKSGAAPTERDFGDAEFQRLMEMAEPDTFGADAARRVAAERETDEEMRKWADAARRVAA